MAELLEKWYGAPVTIHSHPVHKTEKYKGST